jgi:hypothetical protein
MVVVPGPALLVAPCSTKLEYIDEYEEHEVFEYQLGEVDWEPVGNKSDGFAAFRYLHPIDRGYIGAVAGVLVPEACERLRTAYATLVKHQSGDNG